MGAMKQFYTASLEYDRETGASLCARPEWRQWDMRDQEWEAELDCPESGPSATGGDECQDWTSASSSQWRESSSPPKA